MKLVVLVQSSRPRQPDLRIVFDPTTDMQERQVRVERQEVDALGELAWVRHTSHEPLALAYFFGLASLRYPASSCTGDPSTAAVGNPHCNVRLDRRVALELTGASKAAIVFDDMCDKLHQRQHYAG